MRKCVSGLVLAAVVVLVVGGLLAFWMVDNYASGASQTSPSISVDVQPSGNTATSAGTIDACSSAAAGTTFDVDVVVQDLPGLDGYQLDLLYSPSVLSITAIETGLFLGPGAIDFSDSVPDSDGHVLLLSANMEGPARGGSGVLARVTFQAVGSGLTRIKLANVILGQSGGKAIGDSDGDNFFDGPVVDAFLAVDQPCPSAEALAGGAVEMATLPEPPSRVPHGQPPTPEPSPTPLPTPTASSEPVRPPQVVQSASPEITYPPKLAHLPDNVWALASDPTTGDLWFPVLGESAPPFHGLGPRIYRYSPASEKLDFWELPVEPYTGSVLDMAPDDQGNVWLAWGYNIVKFDTSTLSATVYPLDENIQYPTAGASNSGTTVTALAVDSTGKVWFTRDDDAAILELDPASGAVREHAVPAYFALPLVSRMEIDAQGRLWLPGAVPAGTDRADRLGELDTTTGAFTLHDVPVLALTIDKGGQIWLTGGSEGGLQSFDRQSGKASLAADIPIGDPYDFLAVDPSTGDLWLSSFAEAKIGRYSASTGRTGWYTLPVVEIQAGPTAWSVPFPGGIEPVDTGPRRVSPIFEAVTVDGDGDLWFVADGTIGMIPAP
jgi:streptogramin lyase